MDKNCLKMPKTPKTTFNMVKQNITLGLKLSKNRQIGKKSKMDLDFTKYRPKMDLKLTKFKNDSRINWLKSTKYRIKSTDYQLKSTKYQPNIVLSELNID